MKAQFKWIIACTGLCLVSTTAFAQAGYEVLPLSGDTNQTINSREARASVQFCHARNLVGASVKDMQGQKLGDLHDIVFNPKSGEIFAAIGIGRGNYALVPAQALNVAPGAGVISRKADVILNTTKEMLQNGPTITNDDWQKLDTPSFTQSIYSHYKLRVPDAMGGVLSGSLGGTSVGAAIGTNHINKPTTGQP